MRIAVVSDIHGNLPALKAVVRDFTRRGVDAVVNLGDSLSGPLMPMETAQYLMDQDWIHLAGNHERQVLQLTERSSRVDKYAYSQLGQKELDWLASLVWVKPFSPDVLLCHGTPRSDVECLLQNADRNASLTEIEQRLGDTRASLTLCGHSHVPRSVRTRAGHLIVNPGSVGHPAFADDFPHPHVVESGSPDARYAIVEQHHESWAVSLLTVPYAHRAMAAMALSRGFVDWDIALRTGAMF